MSKRQTVIATAVLICQVAYCGSASAFVFWGNQNGNAVGFTWTDGGSDNGSFGDPILVGGNTFVFTPEDFRAESVNGNPGSASDRLQVDLHSVPGQAFTVIRIREGGDYGILGFGSVSASGTLTANDLDVARSDSDNLVTTPGSPINGGQGGWEGVAEIIFPTPVPGDAWTNIRLELQNDLLAISGPGSVSFIQKKFLGIGLAVEIVVPEPGSLALLALGGLPLLLRRRHMIL